MGDIEPIQLRQLAKREAGLTGASQPVAGQTQAQSASTHAVTAFTRSELSTILAVYGRLMAEGECRDYAMDFGRDTAVFSIFRRASEVPLYPTSEFRLLPRMPVFWHPSVGQAQVGDTILVNEDAFELITKGTDWPTLCVTVKGRPIELADLLIRENPATLSPAS